MELREYIRAVRRRWPWILVPVLLAMAGTAALTATGSPVYRSSMVLFVATAGTDDSDLRTSRLNSYVALLTGPRVASAVVAELQLPLSTQSVQEKISAEVQPGTDLIAVTATDKSAELSRAIVTTATTTLAGLARQLDLPRAEAHGPSVAVTVAQDAVTVPEPSGLGRKLGFAAVLGLLLGATAVALRQALRRTVMDERDLRQLGLDTVGVISIDGQPGPAGGAGYYPDQALAEAFRRLRTVLPDHGGARRDGTGGSLLLTGSVPDQGTTAIACGLAIATAEAGTRVVLVDANLRAPGVGRYMSLDSTRGLAEVLAGSVDLYDVLQDSEDGRLTVLPAGYPPADPGEILAAPALSETIDILKTRFDAVLVDAPPLQCEADAAVLSKVTDGVLLVVRAGKTRTADVERSVDLLQRVGARLVGAVVNALPRRVPGQAPWNPADAMSSSQPPQATALPPGPVDGWNVPDQRVTDSKPYAAGQNAAGQNAAGNADTAPTREQPRVAGSASAQGRARVVDLSAVARGQARVVSITDAAPSATAGDRSDPPTLPAQREPDGRQRPGE